MKADFHPLCEGTGNTIITLKLLLSPNTFSKQLSFLVLFEAVFALLANLGFNEEEFSYIVAFYNLNLFSHIRGKGNYLDSADF